MRIDPHIVELEDGVWLAYGDGDPPRALDKSNARVFKSRNMARLGLQLARKYRPFEGAQVLPAYRED